MLPWTAALPLTTGDPDDVAPMLYAPALHTKGFNSMRIGVCACLAERVLVHVEQHSGRWHERESKLMWLCTSAQVLLKGGMVEDAYTIQSLKNHRKELNASFPLAYLVRPEDLI